jgi:hypothetical protein
MERVPGVAVAGGSGVADGVGVAVAVGVMVDVGVVEAVGEAGRGVGEVATAVGLGVTGSGVALPVGCTTIAAGSTTAVSATAGSAARGSSVVGGEDVVQPGNNKMTIAHSPGHHRLETNKYHPFIATLFLRESPRSSFDAAQDRSVNLRAPGFGGSGWESNPPLLARRDQPPILKTGAPTGAQPLPYRTDQV